MKVTPQKELPVPLPVPWDGRLCGERAHAASSYSRHFVLLVLGACLFASGGSCATPKEMTDRSEATEYCPGFGQYGTEKWLGVADEKECPTTPAIERSALAAIREQDYRPGRCVWVKSAAGETLAVSEAVARFGATSRISDHGAAISALQAFLTDYSTVCPGHEPDWTRVSYLQNALGAVKQHERMLRSALQEVETAFSNLPALREGLRERRRIAGIRQSLQGRRVERFQIMSDRILLIQDRTLRMKGVATGDNGSIYPPQMIIVSGYREDDLIHRVAFNGTGYYLRSKSGPILFFSSEAPPGGGSDVVRLMDEEARLMSGQASKAEFYMRAMIEASKNLRMSRESLAKAIMSLDARGRMRFLGEYRSILSEAPKVGQEARPVLQCLLGGEDECFGG